MCKKNWVEHLQTNLRSDQLSTSEGELHRHSHDESAHPPSEPDIVCFPETTDDVVFILKTALQGGILGHIGDGNFHTLIVYDPTLSEQHRAAEQTNRLLALKAIELGGTCTGEHGVGIGKMEFQEAEHGAAISVMKDMKKLLDPYNLLNPGKIFY